MTVRPFPPTVQLRVVLLQWIIEQLKSLTLEVETKAGAKRKSKGRNMRHRCDRATRVSKLLLRLSANQKDQII